MWLQHPRACAPSLLIDCSGALTADQAKSVAPQSLQRVGYPQPCPTPQGPSASSRPCPYALRRQEAGALHLGPGSPSLCQWLPSVRGCGGCCGPAASIAGLCPSEPSCPLRAGTRNPIPPQHPPPGSHLGALCPGPRLSRVGGGRAPPRRPPGLRGAGPPVIAVPGPTTPSVGTVPLAVPPLPVASCPHPRCCTGPSVGLGE